MYRGMPLKVSYGAGVDSTARLIEMVKRGIKVDLILFADTGGEKQETYDYIPLMNEFLAVCDYPPVTVVRKNGKDASLYDECFRKKSLASISYGLKSCSLKWKVQPQDAYCNKRWPLARAAWKAGGKVLSAIGLDGGPRDTCRSSTYANSGAKPGKKYEYWYPLQEWGIDRAECVRVIEKTCLPVPPKSSCFFCGGMKKPEIVALSPTLRAEALRLEENAMATLRTVKGLGRRFSWREFLETEATKGGAG